MPTTQTAQTAQTTHEQPAAGKPEKPETPKAPDRDWKHEALVHAERIGVYEYEVNGKYMEYWSFYGKGEGWYFVRYDLEAGREAFRGANIPWDDTAGVPAFLFTEDGATRYNYMEG